jgi:hypothetical protein
MSARLLEGAEGSVMIRIDKEHRREGGRMNSHHRRHHLRDRVSQDARARKRQDKTIVDEQLLDL